MNRLVKIIDFTNRWLGNVLSWTMAALAVLVVLEVIMRRLFGHPTIWNFEVTKQVYGLLFMILAGFALQKNAHVSIDIIEMRFSAKHRALLGIISYLIFFFPFCIVVLWQGITYASRSWSIDERSWSVFAPPLYPIKTVIPITAFLLLLQGLCVIFENLKTLRNDRDDKSES